MSIMESEEQKVVVHLTIAVEHNISAQRYAARVRQLGLTAYGPREEDAMRHCKRMFAVFVEAHRKAGTLESVLDKSGLQWERASAAEGTYEDLNEANWIRDMVVSAGGVWQATPSTPHREWAVAA